MTGAENVTSRPSGAASETFEDAGTDTFGTSDEDTAVEPAEPSGGADTAGTDEAAGADDRLENGGTAEAAEAPEAVEVVEIPKQQSAEEAADNEAGESARK
ncbi:hypothetical protein EAO71_05945 [Streptomyces sp. ms191]|nr:hypothetical protein EAO71_05945 [Streptomyces sp. ms191]